MSQPMNVLYVEDNQSDADLAGRTLSRAAPHITLVVANSLAGARERLSSGAIYDLVLTDLGLPDGSGLDLIVEIRASGSRLPVVALTGAVAGETAVLALKAGADDYMVKRDDYLARLPAALEAAVARNQSEEARRARSLNVLYATDTLGEAERARQQIAAHAPHFRIELVEGLNPTVERLRGEPRCDVLVADFTTGIDGLELLKFVRDERHLDLPVVLIAVHDDGETAARALRFGGVDYRARRPGIHADLVPIIESIHDRAQLAREQLALRTSEAMLREAERIALFGSWRWDIPADRLTFSEELRRIMGADPALGSNAALQQFLASVHPDDRAHVTANIERVGSSHSPFDMELRVLLHGEEKVLHARSDLVIDANGHPLRMTGSVQDITARRQAERALSESEDRYRDLVEHSHDLICTHDLQGNLLSVNLAATRYTGYEREQLEQMNLRDILVPEARPLLDAYLAEIAANGRASGLMVAQTADGEIREWEYHNTVRLQAGAEPVVRGLATDVTERRRAERVLQESEARFRAVFHSSPIPGAIIAPDRTLFDLNQAFCDVSGFSREEALGKTALALGLWVDNDTRVHFLEEMSRSGLVSGYEVPLRAKDGSRVTALLSGSRISVGGVPHNFISALDITARKEAEKALRENEEKFRAVFELSPATIVLATIPEGIIVETNSAMTEVFGEHREDLIGRTADEMGWWQEAAERQRYLSLLAENHRVDGFEATMRRRDGNVITVLLSGSFVTINGQPHSLTAVVDITARKRAEERTRTSEQRYERVIRNMSDALIIDDLEGRIVLANERFFETFALAPTEPGALKLEDYIAPEWREAVRDRHERRVRGEVVASNFECQGIRGDGSRIWVEVHVAPVIEDGRMTGTQSTIRDITERKLREDALRLLSTGVAHLSGETFFQEMARELALLLGFEIGFVGRLVPAETPRVRMLGWFVDGKQAPPMEYDLAGTPCDLVVGREAVVFPSGVSRLFPGSQMLTQQGLSSYAAVPLFDTAGQALGLVGVMGRKALDRQGQVEAILRLFAVRTAAEMERQRTQAQFQDLFEYSPDGIIIVDRDGMVTAANPQVESLFGYSRAELVGRRVEELLPEDLRERHVHLRRDFTASGEARSMALGRPDLRARRKDGTLFPLEISLSPMQAESGTVVVATLRDTSERARAEAERLALEAQLRQAQKMEAIGTLAGGIAHDFNNILAAIIGNTELAALDIDPGHPAMDTLNEIRRASTRAKDLVRQILAFSRQQEQPRTAAPLAGVVEEVAKLMRAALPAAVEISVTLDPQAPAVLADPSQMHQVLMNLCTNAWQAMEGDGGLIDIRLGGVALDAPGARLLGDLPPGRYARLSVTDSGKGMDRATLERVFEPFFTTKAVGSGTGLGLSVVHGIIRGHGGAIAVTSEPGRGSTFGVYLPASTAAELDARRDEPAFPRGHGEHVLYIDDEESLVVLGRRILEQIGYRVTAFTSPAAAIATLEAGGGDYALLLTDLNMPGVSGLEVVRAVQRLRPGLPTALISGFTTPELRASAAAIGVLEVINKPAGIAEIAAALQRILAGRLPATTL